MKKDIKPDQGVQKEENLGLKDWPEINDWRKEKRESLIRSRIKIGKDKRKSCLASIEKKVLARLACFTPGILGGYWPIKGEFDLRGVMQQARENGWTIALPAVVQSAHPLEFRLWTPEMKLVPGVWNIPVPEQRQLVEPSMLLVPLVGFDEQGYRLGYGGGFYDRTLASFSAPFYAIGVGLDLASLKTIYPQPHDIPMNEIICVSN